MQTLWLSQCSAHPVNSIACINIFSGDQSIATQKLQFDNDSIPTDTNYPDRKRSSCENYSIDIMDGHRICLIWSEYKELVRSGEVKKPTQHATQDTKEEKRRGRGR